MVGALPARRFVADWRWPSSPPWLICASSRPGIRPCTGGRAWCRRATSRRAWSSRKNQDQDRAGPAQGPRRNQGRFHRRTSSRCNSCGPICGTRSPSCTKAKTLDSTRPKHSPADPHRWKEFQPPLGKRREAPSLQSAGRTGRFPGVPQGAGRQGKSRSARSRGRRGIRPLKEYGLLADLTEKLKGFNKKTIVGLLGRASVGAAGHRGR